MAGDTTASAVGRFAGQRGACGRSGTTRRRRSTRQAVVRAVIRQVVVAPVGRGAGNRFDSRRVKVKPLL